MSTFIWVPHVGPDEVEVGDGDQVVTLVSAQGVRAAVADDSVVARAAEEEFAL
ncbi:MAG: hypothetical protein R3C45_10650 [Phycisphaerales bacterium]